MMVDHISDLNKCNHLFQSNGKFQSTEYGTLMSKYLEFVTIHHSVHGYFPKWNKPVLALVAVRKSTVESIMWGKYWWSKFLFSSVNSVEDSLSFFI